MDSRIYRRITALAQGTDLFEAVFALKAFVAAMAALWIAMRIGLDRPYWAVITSYITAQPLAGAVLSKSAFRIVGTITGAIVAVLMVPVLVNAPELLCLGLAGWLGLCSYLSLLDRSPRSYSFALAGYTAAIIGFPSVADPGHIFTIAALRLQEILLGISCSTLVHIVVLPTSTLAHTRRRVHSILGDVRRWLHDALLLASNASEAERRKLATDLHDLHQLIVHLSFESGFRSPTARATRALQLELSRLLPFIGGVEDRLRQLGAAVPESVDVLRQDVARAVGDHQTSPADWDALRRRTRALMPTLAHPLLWEDAVLANFLGRLEIMIDGWHRCTTLAGALDHGAYDRRRRLSLRGEGQSEGGRVLTHRDHGIALRGAIGTVLAVLTTSAIWILTEWPDGAMAVIFAGVWTALFSSLDDARPVMRQVLLGTFTGGVLAVIYVGAILPRVTDFVTLAGVLAPTFLVMGALTPRRSTGLFAIGMFNSFPGFLMLANNFGGTVPQVLNTAMAQGFGTAVSLLAMSLTRVPGLRRSVKVMLRTGRRELAQRARAPKPKMLSAWTYLMLDRIAVLAPRLSFLRMDPEPVVTALLRDIRTGICMAELRETAQGLRPGSQRAIDVLMARIGAFVEQGKTADPQAVVRAIDACLRHASRWEGVEQRRRAVVALVGLRRNLLHGRPDPGPAAMAPRGILQA
ncbi:FUSC family protein [Novosphingobium sp. 9]|uniref:FUSC family protein n=1 Tax=Novosphingobium sp. 9 TaxID=2025349 RepID=UPI0021B586B6|nr:FUSC family protein [Novosphingobium sp. 9]